MPNTIGDYVRLTRVRIQALISKIARSKNRTHNISVERSMSIVAARALSDLEDLCREPDNTKIHLLRLIFVQGCALLESRLRKFWLGINIHRLREQPDGVFDV